MEFILFPLACLAADVKRKSLDQQEVLPTSSLSSCGNRCMPHREKFMPHGTGGGEGKEKQTLRSNVFMLRLYSSVALHTLVGLYYSCLLIHAKLLCIVCFALRDCICDINWQIRRDSNFPGCWL